MFSTLGRTYWFLGSYAEALPWFVKSLALLEQTGQYTAIAECLTQIGMVRDGLRNYVGATQAFRRSMQLRRKIGDWEGVVSSLVSLGLIEARQHHYHESAALFLKAERTLRRSTNHAQSAETFALSVPTWLALGERGRARASAQKAIVQARKAGSRRKMALAIRSLANCDAFDSDWQGSEKNFRKAVRLFSVEDADVEVARTLLDFGSALKARYTRYRDSDSLAISLRCLSQAYAIYKTRGYRRRAMLAKLEKMSLASSLNRGFWGLDRKSKIIVSGKPPP